MVILQSLISLVLLLTLIVFLVNDYRVDSVRQQLFDVRDRLFDEAVAGRISFDSRSYRYTRTVINGMIRFGHRISLSRFMVAIFLYDREHLVHRREHRASVLGASSESDRVLCARYLEETNKVVVRYLGRSPFMCVALIPVVAGALAAAGFSVTTMIIKECRNLLARLDDVAFEEGRRAAKEDGQAFS